ncbi:MAG: acyl transferase [Cytophagales bacterium]
MDTSVILKERVLSVNDAEFEALAIDIFRFQYTNNSIYQQFVDALKVNVSKVESIIQIPFLPIEFYKTHKVVSNTSLPIQKIYESSGTTGSVVSKNYVVDENFYFKVSKSIFEAQFGDLNQYIILALLPNYLERGNSSLVAMVNYFMNFSAPESSFYLSDFEKLNHFIQNKPSDKKLLLWGVTYALLDFVDLYSPDLLDVMLIETGGMKGRKKEMIRAEVYEYLNEKSGASFIGSEYGMTELFSQAYSSQNGIFTQPNTLKVVIREANDPFNFLEIGRRGGINIIDLANIDTCSFIATQDLGLKLSENTFEVLGRFDTSDVRGCNLMVSN